MNNHFSADQCRKMIRHYQAEMFNWTKPASWHELAARSVAEWQYRLELAIKG